MVQAIYPLVNGQGRPTFNQDFGTNGVDNLDASLTINGVTVTPSFRYKGGDADGTDWAAWGYGDTLPIAGYGATPDINNGSPLLGDNDDSVEFNSGKHYENSSTSLGDINLEDHVLELVVKWDINNSRLVIGKTDGTNVGWLIQESGDGLSYRLDGGTKIPINSSALINDTWYHAMCFIDRSGSGQWYVNGVASGSAADISSQVSNSMSNSDPMTIGALLGGTIKYLGGIAYVAAWKRLSWLDTHLQADVAAERFAKLTGVYAGSSRGTKLPVTATRASVAYLDKYENRADVVIPDSDMEDVGTSDWAAIDCTLSKVTAGAYNGAQSLRCTATSGSYGATQDVLVAGDTYFITGHARGDGSADKPMLRIGSTAAWTGTTSTTWQSFSETFIATDATLYLWSPDATGYVEWDDIVLVNLGTRNMYQVGDNWMRTCKRIDAAENFSGYLSETGNTNLCLQSETFESATWARFRLPVVANSVPGPNKETTADTLAEDAAVGVNHYIRQVLTITSGVLYTSSVWVKAANRTWVRILMSDSASHHVYVNLSSGAQGNTSGTAVWNVEDWGDGWFRISATSTSISTELIFYIIPAEGDNDDVFDGLSQDSIYVWGAQVEASDYMSSYIPTTTAAVSRAADRLLYKTDDGVLTSIKGSVECDILMPDFTMAAGAAGDSYPWALADGVDAANRTICYLRDGKAYTQFHSSETGSSLVSGTTDVVSNNISNLKVSFRSLHIDLKVDGTAEGTPSTTGTPPNDIDAFSVGTQRGGAAGLNGLINNIKIKKR